MLFSWNDQYWDISGGPAGTFRDISGIPFQEHIRDKKFFKDLPETQRGLSENPLDPDPRTLKDFHGTFHDFTIKLVELHRPSRKFLVPSGDVQERPPWKPFK